MISRIDYRCRRLTGMGRISWRWICTHMIRCGWSMDLSLPVADRAMLHSDNAYLLAAMYAH